MNTTQTCKTSTFVGIECTDYEGEDIRVEQVPDEESGWLRICLQINRRIGNADHLFREFEHKLYPSYVWLL